MVVRAADAAAEVFDFDTALTHYPRALRLGLDASAAYAVHDRRLTLLNHLYRIDEQLRELAVPWQNSPSRSTTRPAPFTLASKRAATLINSGRVADALVLASWVAKGAPSLPLKVHARYIVGSALMFLGDHSPQRNTCVPHWSDAPTAQPAYEPMICVFLATSRSAAARSTSHRTLRARIACRRTS